MKKIFNIFAIVAVSLGIYSCEEYSAGDENANKSLSYSFSRDKFTHEIVEDSPVYPLEVYATETSTEDRIIEVEINTGVDAAGAPLTTAAAGDFTLESTSIVIPAGSLKGSTDITFDPANIAMGTSRKVTFDLIQPLDGSVVNVSKSRFELSYTPLCPFNKVEFNLVLDRYGSETSWEVLQGTTVVASGGPYTDGTTNAVQPAKKFTFCLEDGDYTLVVYDAYGDGMVTSATVRGSYTIKHNGVTLVSGDGNFATESRHDFTL